jgi:hypothetical protein
MKLPFTILFLMMSVAFASEKYSGWPKALQDIPYEDDVTLTIPGFSIRYFIPRDAESQMGGGSGGPIGQIDITNQKTKKTISFDFQTIGGRILEAYHGYPQFEIWSRAGGGSYCRCLFRFENGKFHNIRIDDFSVSPDQATDKSVTTTLTRSDDTLYYVSTRYPTSNTD